MKKMGLFAALAGVAMVGAGLPVGDDIGRNGWSWLLPTFTNPSDSQAERTKRNLTAGGRRKRIAKQKARKSFGRRRSTVRSGKPSTTGRIFLSDNRHAVFLETMKALEPIVGNYEARRAQAIRAGRRAPALAAPDAGRLVPAHRSGPSYPTPTLNPPHHSGAAAAA